MEYLIELEQSKLFDKEYLSTVILSEISRMLPEKIKTALDSDEKRKDYLAKYGEKAFLLPSELKFPVINPETGEYCCQLIYAARIRAKQFGYKEVAEKAEDLYGQNKCGAKIGVKLHESVYELGLLLDILQEDTDL